MSDKARIAKKALRLVALLPLFFFLVLFLPAGTARYWQAWLYCGLLLAALGVAVLYLLNRHPEFLERRMRTKERERTQQRIQLVITPIIFAGYVVAGLDHRFSWSGLPDAVVVAADVLVLAGYVFVIAVFRENSYASRVVEVVEGQTVISTGPYAWVRHPMYTGTIIMYLATPIALNSLWALLLFVAYPVALVFRIRNEEALLVRELAGYAEYRQKVRYRLIPFVW